MAEISVFHKLIRVESDYTQMLCNVLQRDRVFRDAVLAWLFPQSPIASVKSEHIRREVFLRGHGRCDLIVANEKMLAILEVKLGAKTQESQTGRDDYGYMAHLRSVDSRQTKWMTFLIPMGYELAAPTHDANIHQQTRYWEELFHLTCAISGKQGLGNEVAAFLKGRFGSMSFTEAETTLLYSTSFPVREALKLWRLIDRVAKQLRVRQSDWETVEDEAGFYLRDGERCMLFFGIIAGFTRRDGNSPLVFGIDSTWEEDIPGITEAFEGICSHPQHWDTWLFDTITQDELRQPDAVKVISERLTSVVHRITTALNPGGNT